MTLFSNDPPRPLLHRAFYRTVQCVTLFLFRIYFGYQFRHVDRLPSTGGALICPNHFSNLDPMAIGCIARRRVNFLAKKSLLEHWLLGRILIRLDCIPIDRESSGISGMKETLRKLKKGESVVMFPEGGRSEDGNLQPVLTGFTALVKRVKVPVIPIGIHGTFEAWPPGASKPKSHPLRVVVGEPIAYSEMENMSEQEMAEFVARKIAVCYDEAKQWNR